MRLLRSVAAAASSRVPALTAALGPPAYVGALPITTDFSGAGAGSYRRRTRWFLRLTLPVVGQGAGFVAIPAFVGFLLVAAYAPSMDPELGPLRGRRNDDSAAEESGASVLKNEGDRPMQRLLAVAFTAVALAFPGTALAVAPQA
jgi:hypothetical protein